MKIYYLLFLGSILFSCNNWYGFTESTSIIPTPSMAKFTTKKVRLPKEITFKKIPKGLEQISTFIQVQINKFSSQEFRTENKESIALSFVSNNSLGKEAYLLNIKEDSIIIEASEHFGFVRAAASLLQLIDGSNELPIGIISDGPEYDYRGLMLDCSRSWYSIATLKQIIDLCFWYKIKYLHLHLTDDLLFTFQSIAFPKLASKQSYSPNELKALNEYAYQRGCILIPEIDMPSHSSPFVAKYPEIFGINSGKQNYWTINMGKTEAYDAIQLLLKEVAEAFPHSPYIHLGGDEVNYYGMDNDPDIKAYMKKQDLKDFDELYHHFIVKVTRMVKALGKTPIIWSDFTNKGGIKVPNDVSIMVWKTGAYHPDSLAKDGFQIINASWQPLYVVNNRKWTSEDIYNWNPRIWKGSQTPSHQKGILMKPDSNLQGASMSVWEQNEFKAFISLKHRLAAMSEQLWNTSSLPYSNFAERLSNTEEQLNKFLYSFKLEEKGLSYPDWEDSNFSEHMWFSDSLSISATPVENDISIGYNYFAKANAKRAIPPIAELQILDSNLIVKENTTLMFQAFRNTSNDKRKAVGHPIFKSYSLHPVHVKADTLLENYLPHNWEHHKFTDSLKITLRSKLDGDLFYTLDNSVPNTNSIPYNQSFYLNKSAQLRARLFEKGTNKPIGNGFHQEFVKLGIETSLTTGKAVSTSNRENELGVTSFINDGRIARWDHWGDHTDEENWVIIDLGKEEEISRFKTYTFWDGYRYYEYTIEVSKDNVNWETVVDRSKNKEISKPEGITDSIAPTKARYLKLNLLRNSANPGLHLVEFNAFH